jgi:hypothetical protein
MPAAVKKLQSAMEDNAPVHDSGNYRELEINWIDAAYEAEARPLRR